MKCSGNGELIFSLAVAAILTGSAGPSFAADDIACAIYAKTAVAQNAANLAEGCDLSGPRWNSDENYHVSWCIEQDLAAADGETKARSEDLKKCTGSLWPAGSHRRCNIYALVAVAQNEANEKAYCGYSGARWRSEYSNHYGWCIQVGKNMADQESEARRLELMACAPSP